MWRVTAALSALVLGAMVLACAQGSLTVIAQRPAPGIRGKSAAGAPAWEQWCTRGHPREDRRRLAFCARVEGRVLDSTYGPGRGEAHVAVLGDFHVVVVRLPEWTKTPSVGSRVTAIGPLFRSRDGQPEVQAFRFDVA